MQFKTEPRSYQLRMFERFKDREYFALFMDMGTGKTKTTLDIAAHKYFTGQCDSFLIIAPNHVHSQWIRKEIPKHLACPYREILWTAQKSHSKRWIKELHDFSITRVKQLKILSVNVEAFQSDGILPYIGEYVKNNKVFIVIDEATRIKHGDAKRSKTIHRLSKYGQRAILTGTPTAQSPFNLWSMMEFLKENYFGCNYFIFKHRYGIMSKNENKMSGKEYKGLIDEKQWNIVKYQLRKYKESRGSAGLMPTDYEDIGDIVGLSDKNVKLIDTQDKYTKYKNLDKLKAFVENDVGSITFKEAVPEMPEPVREVIYVDMSAEQKKVYKELKSNLIAQYGDKTLTVANKIALLTRLQQVTGGFFPYMEEEGNKIVTKGTLIGSSNVKVDALLEDLDEVNFDSMKVMVWARFHPELEHLYAVLRKEYNCCLYYGPTPTEEREQIKNDFSEGKYDIFIGSQASAAFGLNFQIAPLHYYFSNDQVNENRLQAEMRSRRMDKIQVCIYKDLIIKGTYDEKIYENIKNGRDMNEYFKNTDLRDILNEEETDE